MEDPWEEDLMNISLLIFKDDLQSIINTLDEKADSETIEKLVEILDQKADKAELGMVVDLIKNKAEKTEVEYM